MPEGSKRKGPGFSSLILGSLILGIAAGLFFGDLAAPLQVLGQAYVGLLQMTVLPYILFSLIGNIGRLTRAQAGILARTGLIVLLALWAMAGLVVPAVLVVVTGALVGALLMGNLADRISRAAAIPCCSAATPRSCRPTIPTPSRRSAGRCSGCPPRPTRPGRSTSSSLTQTKPIICTTSNGRCV